MDLVECRAKGFIKNTTKNISLIKSLIEMSNSKELAVNTATISSKRFIKDCA